ncbi:MAG: hypothetical protein ACYDBH_01440 [Acidobacteriaceae bacterium]
MKLRLALLLPLALLAGCTTLPTFMTQTASAPYQQAVSALCTQAGAAMAQLLVTPGGTSLQVQNQINTLAAAAAPVCARPAPPIVTPAQQAALAQALVNSQVQSLKP